MQKDNDKITRAEFVSFDINSFIKVKLTDKGLQYLLSKYEETKERYPFLEETEKEPRTVEYYTKQTDKAGYTRFQMWRFMALFSEVLDVPQGAFFEGDIILFGKDLKGIRQDLYASISAPNKG